MVLFGTGSPVAKNTGILVFFDTGKLPSAKKYQVFFPTGKSFPVWLTRGLVFFPLDLVFFGTGDLFGSRHIQSLLLYFFALETGVCGWLAGPAGTWDC